jgi:tight adherence protein B
VLHLVILTFVTIFLVFLALFLGFTAVKESPTADLKRRLRRMAMAKDTRTALPDDLRAEIIKEIPPVERLLARIPLVRNLDKLLDQAGRKIAPARFLVYVIALALFGFALAFVLRKNYPIALLAGLVLASFPFIYLQTLKRKRAEKFTEQLPDALTMLGRSLRAGHSLNSAVELVGTEMSEPVAGLFKVAFEQQKLGLRITETLANMTTRIESIDLRFFVVVISVHTEVGGNLSEVLDKLAETIRERIKLRRQVKVYTAQGRMSGYLLAVLPIVVFILFQFIMMPGYEDVLIKETKGHYILAAAFVSQIIGFLFIKKIINIRI